MSRQYWQETIRWDTASSTAVANTTTETVVVANLPIRAYELSDGRILRLRVIGGYGTTATPTLQFRLRLGGVTGTVLAASGAITTPSSAGGGASMTALWIAEFVLQTRANGASGTLMTNGCVTLFTTGTAGGSVYPIASGSTGGTTPAEVTADLTANADLAITVQWGTAAAANSIRAHQYVVESLN